MVVKPEASSGERLALLRKELSNRGADAMIIPSGDPHNSEYAAGMYQRRAYISGFTGSAGIAVVTSKEALLWTDGRYYTQAEKQLSMDEWTLMRGSERETPSVGDWLSKSLEKGNTVLIDPYVHSSEGAANLKKKLGKKNIKLAFSNIEDRNPVDAIWGDERPKAPSSCIRIHPKEFAGCSTKEKLEQIRTAMREKSSTHCLFSMLDEVAWLFNIRGDDIPHCPVVISYAMISLDSALFYVDDTKIQPEVRAYLTEQDVTIAPYERIVPDLESVAKMDDVNIWISPSSTSIALRDAVGNDDLILSEETPISMLKAVKNKSELDGMKHAHLKDAAALTTFLCWLEDYVKDGAKISEVEASKKLLELRAGQDGFNDTSFDTIAGYGSNGAIIHYKPQVETCAEISRDEVFLCDSGGQYCDGTTDVTRTVHLGGTPTEYEKDCFTRVLQGHIGIDTAVFPENTSGLLLDTLARAPLWKMGLDYRHGTGHGVGACLNVHEGPQSISAHIKSKNYAPLKAGMIVSNEPGYYESGKFGIRIENLVYVVEKTTEHEFGGKKSLGFEPLTFVPIDKCMMNLELLSDEEIQWVDKYHAECWEKISGRIGDKKTKEWLREKTLPIARTGEEMKT